MQRAAKIAAPRRRLQFGLSTALIAVTAVAVAAAWVALQSRTVRDRQRLTSDIRDRGGSVYSAADLALNGRLPAVRLWFGDEPVARIYLPPPDFTHDDFEHVRAAFPEAHVFPLSPLSFDADKRSAPR